MPGQFLMALFHFYSPVYFSRILQTTFMCAYVHMCAYAFLFEFSFLCSLVDCLEDCFIKSRDRLAECREGLLLLSEIIEAN